MSTKKSNKRNRTGNSTTSGSKSMAQDGTKRYTPKRSRQSKASYDDRYKEDSSAPSRNDIGWYTSSPNLLAAAASIPYNHLTGTITNTGGTLGDDHKHYAVPGAISLSIIPCPGFAALPSDPVNVASNAIYSFVRHQNSGHANYDAPDLMLYLMAMDNAYTYLNWLQRLYGTVHMYSAVNRYLPRDLIEMQGVDYDDLLANIAQFRYAINAAITRLGSLCVPNNMPIFQRHSSIFGNYYIEGDSYREQLYMYTPKLVYMFGINSDGAGTLIPDYLPTPSSAQLESVESLINRFNLMINAISYDEDMNIMSGDILKAYGPENLVTLSLLPEMYICTPQRNFEVLEQFQNSYACGMPEKDSLQIYQELNDMAGRIRFLPRYGRNDGTVNNEKLQLIAERKVITTSNTSPTPEITMLNTRLIPSIHTNMTDGSDDANSTGSYLRVGSEIPCDYTILYYSQEGNDVDTRSRHYKQFISWEVVDSRGASASLPAIINEAALLSAFKFAPEIRVALINKVNNETDSVNVYPSFFQVDTYTTVDMSTLERIHEAALLGEWNVERLAITK